MVYNEKLTALHKALTSIHPEQDRINFAPRLAEDIRLRYIDPVSGTEKYLNFNKIYTADDPYFPELAGTIWVVSDIDGWWTLAEPGMPNIERGFGDGSFDISGRNLARDITFNGSIIIQSGNRDEIATLSAAARSVLLNAFNLVKKKTWMIVDEDQYKRASEIRLSGRPQVSTVNSRGRIDFSIGLRAADPIKYEWVEDTLYDENFFPPYEVVTGNGYNLTTVISDGASANVYRSFDNNDTSDQAAGSDLYDYRVYTAEAYDSSVLVKTYPYTTNAGSQVISGSTTATNHGDANVYPYFRIIGPLYGPATITNSTTGQSMTFSAPTGEVILLPSSTVSTVEFLDIDTRTKEVHKGNFTAGEEDTSSRGLLDPLIDWIYLQPGDNVIYFEDSGTPTSSTNSPSFQIYWRSGWSG